MKCLSCRLSRILGIVFCVAATTCSGEPKDTEQLKHGTGISALETEARQSESHQSGKDVLERYIDRVVDFRLARDIQEHAETLEARKKEFETYAHVPRVNYLLPFTMELIRRFDQDDEKGLSRYAQPIASFISYPSLGAVYENGDMWFAAGRDENGNVKSYGPFEYRAATGELIRRRREEHKEGQRVPIGNGAFLISPYPDGVGFPYPKVTIEGVEKQVFYDVRNKEYYVEFGETRKAVFYGESGTYIGDGAGFCYFLGALELRLLDGQYTTQSSLSTFHFRQGVFGDAMGKRALIGTPYEYQDWQYSGNSVDDSGRIFIPYVVRLRFPDPAGNPLAEGSPITEGHVMIYDFENDVMYHLFHPLRDTAVPIEETVINIHYCLGEDQQLYYQLVTDKKYYIYRLRIGWDQPMEATEYYTKELEELGLVKKRGS